MSYKGDCRKFQNLKSLLFFLQNCHNPQPIFNPAKNQRNAVFRQVNQALSLSILLKNTQAKTLAPGSVMCLITIKANHLLGKVNFEEHRNFWELS